MAEEMGERTEQPTGRRRFEAREQGQVARSPLLASSLGLVAGFILLLSFGAGIVKGLAGLLRVALDDRLSGKAIALDLTRATADWIFTHAALLVLPFFIILVLVALVIEIAQVGWHPTTQPLVPTLSRLNPIAGLGKLGGRRNLVRSSVSLAKLTLLAIIVAIIIAGEWSHIVTLTSLELRPLLAEVARIIWRICVWLLSVLLFIGLCDWAYHKWQLTQDLRMTKQQVKEEHRMMEGDPEIKGRRLKLARQIAMQRLGQTVPKADVIVTNPTHFAVALQYDQKNMVAPKVIAKGADAMAFRIRELAAANNIPIVERPPLARAMYHTVPVGKTIKPEFYEAVAEILAYVYRLSGKAA